MRPRRVRNTVLKSWHRDSTTMLWDREGDDIVYLGLTGGIRNAKLAKQPHFLQKLIQCQVLGMSNYSLLDTRCTP